MRSLKLTGGRSAHTAGCLALLFITRFLNAQEVITPLAGNPAVAETRDERAFLKMSNASQQLELPFRDDFSSRGNIPDQDFWIDARAFVNNNYGVDPITGGIATLDALDENGSIYPNAVHDPATFEADHLTSHPINLAYPASDSIYLSFYYQAGGLGDLPETQDSLLLDFYDTGDGEWVNIWGTGGDTMSPFKQVLVPVTEARFLADGFRFRFRNLASLPRNRDYPDKMSNVDHWHLDYIRLDRNRSAADTVIRDVAFIGPVPPMLKRLTAMPWAHFETAYQTVFESQLPVRYRNNDTISRNVTRTLTVTDLVHGGTSRPAEPTAQDIPPLSDTVVEFNYIYPFDLGEGDSARFRLTASLRTDEFDPAENDTVIHDQVFSDFYAYDDGTAEAGYGLRGQGTRNGSVAIGYNSYEPDLLGGVDIFFNQLLDSVNLDYYFKLMVWDGSEGKPGSVIWEDEEDHTPDFTSSLLGFRRYYFSSPVPVDGPYYVGWIQYNEYMLNVGLDRNNRLASTVMFYNYQGKWEQSGAPGVMLFRPFLYREPTGAGEEPRGGTSPIVYPNPASDRVQVRMPGEHGPATGVVEVFDLQGRLVARSDQFSGFLNVSTLEEGIYLVRVVSGGRTASTKLVINR